jgi:phosphoenolpyruvate carboxylase
MTQPANNLEQFNNLVSVKYQLYNSLFTSLPFHRIEKTGVLLSLLMHQCEEGYRKKLNPTEIIDTFFSSNTEYDTEDKKRSLLFRFIQYIERQVVLFDALEDAAFTQVHDMHGAGTLKQLELEVKQEQQEDSLRQKLKTFSIRLILTAHPTQFYPDTVLGIINDLSKSLSENDTPLVNTYLQQLGKTPFFKQQKPSPYEEAISLTWFLENVFYAAAGNILSSMKQTFPGTVCDNHPLIQLGFWPGGDRDGNPFVTSDTTIKVARALRNSITRCYYLEIRRLKRRLTFKGVDTILSVLEQRLYQALFSIESQQRLTVTDILLSLNQALQILNEQHGGLFKALIENLVNKVQVFGLYFATLDIRQNSAIHTQVWESLAKEGVSVAKNYISQDADMKMKFLGNLESSTAPVVTNEMAKETLNSIRAMKTIQEENGEAGCNRYIISHCNSALQVMELYGLFVLSGWQADDITADIVPLFETIEDLRNASQIMKTLYEDKTYGQHLKRRNMRQTVMLGFSDGSKDGGYLMGNWSIYKAKEMITELSRNYQVDVIFFDGRGGPPSRGGGKTNRFYASMGKNIAQKEIQVTIQGQTISSNFGTVASAQYNMEGLVHAGIFNELFSNKNITLQAGEEKLMEALADISLEAYTNLKEHPQFLDYLTEISPLRFYAEANIGSRPASRSNLQNLDDLRAIPFVGAWTQLKQNIAGFFGVGAALAELEKKGKWAHLQKMYEHSLYFKTILDNAEMSMLKCFFPLTAYLENDKKFSNIWCTIRDEYELTKKYVLMLSGKAELMEDYPADRLSILTREHIILPLVTIQQYAIMQLRASQGSVLEKTQQEGLEKLVIRSSFGIINAGRNSV